MSRRTHEQLKKIALKRPSVKKAYEALNAIPIQLNINNINTLIHDQLVSADKEEEYSKSAVLSTLIGFKRLFVHHEILLPDRRASAPHRHTHREEMAIVLSGEPTA